MPNVSYLSAHKGGIQMFSDSEIGIVGYGKTPESIAYVLNTKGIAHTVFQSSSMDFASGEGFDTDDGAKLLFKRALELI
tara:strand:+ start:1661 stop:1897 length:237 start_codon:yes stop_codon:yes gene_type:complete